MDYEPDRPRGMLSPADREFLLGETEMDHDQSRRNAEARIRERVTNALLDFNLLIHNLREKDRRQIFEKSMDDDEFREGLMAALSFAYAGTRDAGVDFAHVLEPAIRTTEEAHAAKTLGSTVDVDVTFDVETTPRTQLDDVTAKIEAGEVVTTAELFSVVVDDADALDHVDHVLVQRDSQEAAHANTDFIEKFATFLDGEIEERPLNRVRIHIGGRHPETQTPSTD